MEKIISSGKMFNYEMQLKSLIKAKSGHSDNCAICLNDLKNDITQIESCGHAFHNTCILLCKEKNGDTNVPCPTCRTGFATNN